MIMDLSRVRDFRISLPYRFSRIPEAEKDDIELQEGANNQSDENQSEHPKRNEEPNPNPNPNPNPIHYEADPYRELSFDEVQPEILVPFLFMGLILWGIYYALIENDDNNPSVPPKLYLNSFNVSKFNVSNGVLSAVWDVELTLYNPNNASVHNDITIYAMEAAILYKGKAPLSVSTIVPKALFLPQLRYSGKLNYFPDKDIVVRPNENKTLHLTFHIPSDENHLPPLDSSIIEQIVEDRKHGIMEFSMEVSMEAEAEFPSHLFVPHLEAYPHWKNLVVQFGQEKTDAATLIGPLHRQNSGASLWAWNDDIYSNTDPEESHQ